MTASSDRPESKSDAQLEEPAAVASQPAASSSEAAPEAATRFASTEPTAPPLSLGREMSNEEVGSAPMPGAVWREFKETPTEPTAPPPSLGREMSNEEVGSAPMPGAVWREFKETPDPILAIPAPVSPSVPTPPPTLQSAVEQQLEAQQQAKVNESEDILNDPDFLKGLEEMNREISELSNQLNGVSENVAQTPDPTLAAAAPSSTTPSAPIPQSAVEQQLEAQWQAKVDERERFMNDHLAKEAESRDPNFLEKLTAMDMEIEGISKQLNGISKNSAQTPDPTLAAATPSSTTPSAPPESSQLTVDSTPAEAKPSEKTPVAEAKSADAKPATSPSVAESTTPAANAESKPSVEAPKKESKWQKFKSFLGRHKYKIMALTGVLLLAAAVAFPPAAPFLAIAGKFILSGLVKIGIGAKALFSGIPTPSFPSMPNLSMPNLASAPGISSIAQYSAAHPIGAEIIGGAALGAAHKAGLTEKVKQLISRAAKEGIAKNPAGNLVTATPELSIKFDSAIPSGIKPPANYTAQSITTKEAGIGTLAKWQSNVNNNIAFNVNKEGFNGRANIDNLKSMLANRPGDSSKPFEVSLNNVNNTRVEEIKQALNNTGANFTLKVDGKDVITPKVEEQSRMALR